MPYRLFHDYVPGFSGIRVTARFFVVTVLALTMLAAAGYAALARRLRSPRLGALVAVLVVGVVCADLSADVGWAELPDDRQTLAVYRALADKADGAAVELPMADPRVSPAGWAYVEATRMVYGTLDWHPRVNGYSGFEPASYTVDIDGFNQLPAPAGFAHAKELRVRYLVLHVGDEHGFPAFTEQAAEDIVAARPTGSTATRHGSAWLIDLAA
jgi:hypothetical protein